MITRLLVAVVFIPVVLLTVSVAPLWCFFLLLEVFLVAALWEFYRLLKDESLRGFELTALLTAASPFVAWLSLLSLYFYLTMIPLLLMVQSMVRTSFQNRNLAQISANVLCFIYLSIPFSLAVRLRVSQDGASGHELAFLLICVWVSDSAGYFVGRSVGQHKVLPRLSPNKSLEGFTASLFAPSLVAALIQPHILPGQSAWGAALLGGVIGGSGIAGDLFESFLKRRAGMKDSSALIPGHGGVLDRLDSLLFVLPAYYFLTRIVW